jgi:hypothetical protein
MALSGHVMVRLPLQMSNAPDAPKRRTPPRALFVVAYPVAVLIELCIASLRMGEFVIDAFWHALGLFPVGLGALFVWSKETFRSNTGALLIVGWMVWIVVIGAGLIAPTYRKLALVGIVAIANIGGCNLDHFWADPAP